MKNNIKAILKSTMTFAISAIVLISTQVQAAPHGMYLTKQALDEKFIQNLMNPTTNSSTENLAGQLKYYGGPVISHVKVYAVMWGKDVDSATQSQIGDYFAATVNSTYMDWLSEYNTNVTAVDGRKGTDQVLGRGKYMGLITITPKNTANKIDDKEIQAELDAQIAAGNLPKPDADTLFMTYFPPGVTITIEGMASCSQFCAYHESYNSQKFGSVFYGIMPDLGGMCSFGCGFQPTRFDALTVVSAHELIEAVTDPNPTPGDKPAFPQAWNTIDGQEIGDLCNGTTTQLTAGNRKYLLQQEFDNNAGACAVGPYEAK